jgi:hypothetical protein
LNPRIVSGSATNFAANVALGTTATSTASCPAGANVLGGGGEVVNFGAQIAVIASSFPSNPGGVGTWTVTAVVVVHGNATSQVQAFAVCG